MAKKSVKAKAKKVQPKKAQKKTQPKKTQSIKTKAKPAPKKKVVLKKAAKPSRQVKAQKTSSTKNIKLKNTKPKVTANSAPKKLTAQPNVNSKLLNEGAPFSPLGDKVLIKKADGTFEKTAGGLFIPSTAQEKPTEGSVIAVGPGVKTKKGFLKPLDVKVGDKVMYEKYAGMELKFNGQEFLILTENEIIGVVS